MKTIIFASIILFTLSACENYRKVETAIAHNGEDIVQLTSIRLGLMTLATKPGEMQCKTFTRSTVEADIYCR